ncbi:MAG: hypothetical protein HKN40_09430 [Winogradskyella sp.]|uniref:hypothetical protein n=1 Tax=Winogradskyella sp. TaxID=1883156 RepID=UPI0017B2B7E5|nr:hypothetical protein [Winogradskyella sp.]
MKKQVTQFKNLPKADVHSHLHLAGSQHRFAHRYPDAQLNFPISYNGLSGMIDFIYGHLNTIMLTDKDVINFMEIAIESAIDDNITLLEASIDLGLARFFNNNIEKVIEVVQTLKEDYKSQINFKPDLGINKDLLLGKLYSDGIVCLESGVFNGIDLYGQEKKKDLKPFVRFYEMAKTMGHKTKVHIGEFSDPQSINETINLLQPQELQHGIRAVESNRTMDLILENNIRLNICPTSNILLGAVDNIKNHPIRKLFDYGIKVTINTDDLILFDTTVSEEFLKLFKENIFSFEELDVIRQNAFN